LIKKPPSSMALLGGDVWCVWQSRVGPNAASYVAEVALEKKPLFWVYAFCGGSNARTMLTSPAAYS
jgi:hypothetical protein